jgi:hypothetical protein
VTLARDSACKVGFSETGVFEPDYWITVVDSSSYEISRIAPVERPTFEKSSGRHPQRSRMAVASPWDPMLRLYQRVA